MGRFLRILVVVFVIVFVFQQSRVVEIKLVYDTVLATDKVEYTFNWGNLGVYIGDVFNKLKEFPYRMKLKLRRKGRSPQQEVEVC